jgi:hypothetical protein
MFDDVIIDMKGLQARRAALRLAEALHSAQRHLAPVHGRGTGGTPALDSGAARAAGRRGGDGNGAEHR